MRSWFPRTVAVLGCSIVAGGASWMAATSVQAVPQPAVRAEAEVRDTALRDTALRDAAWSHLRAHAEQRGVPASALKHAELALLHDVGDGAIVARFVQRVGGFEVLGPRLQIVMDQALAARGVFGALSAADASAVALPSTSTQAAQRALSQALSGHFGHDWDIAPAPAADDGYARFAATGMVATGAAAGNATGAALLRPARVKPVYALSEGALVPAHYVEFLARADGREHGFAYAVAADGTPLWRRELIRHDAFRYLVWADSNGFKAPQDGPQTNFTPHPSGSPDGSLPVPTSQRLVGIEGFNTNPAGVPDPWLPSSAMVTRGNNVDAYVDHALPDGFSSGDRRGSLSGTLTFSHRYDLGESPLASSEQAEAAAVQLFYVTNWLHDVYYDAGFDEAAGNAQYLNFGRGGEEDDVLLAEAQDRALDPTVRNQASMFVPADGDSPRLSISLWDVPEEPIERSGSLDAHLVAHEWAHYLHDRLVDCNALQCGALAEGWADFVALHMTLREQDDTAGAYPLGVYVATGDQRGYFGMRRVPYSVSPDNNALSLRHLMPEEPLPESHPVRPSPAPNDEVHNAGEVWASMLWEGYVALIEDRGPEPAPDAPPRLSFAEARARMADYAVATLMAAPSNPTLAEQRDALLAVAGARDARDLEVLAEAFARRGAGTCAQVPARDADTLSGVLEDFSLSADMALGSAYLVDSVLSCDGDGTLDAGERGTLVIEVHNPTLLPLEDTEVVVASENQGLTLPFGDTLTVPLVAPQSTELVSFAVTAADALSAGTPLRFTVSASNPRACVELLEETLDFGQADAYDCPSAGYPPVADAGGNLLVWSGQQVVLDAAGSFDPDGDMLRFSWSQREGPEVSLSQSDSAQVSFTAPEVEDDVVLRFEVSVADTTGVDDAQVDVTVRPRPAILDEPGELSEGDGGCVVAPGGNAAGGTGALAWLAALAALLWRRRSVSEPARTDAGTDPRQSGV